MSKNIFTSFKPNMENISFTSNIKLVSCSDFHKITSGFGKKNFVDYPWMIKDSVVGENVYTTRICDCTSCLITDGQKAILMHLNPAKKSNHIFSDVIRFLRDNIDLKQKDLQAVLLGSRDTKPSQDIWNKFCELLKKFDIPVSKLKNGKWGTNLAYNKSKDEVLISSYPLDKGINKGLSKTDLLKSHFKEVSISECDELI